MPKHIHTEEDNHITIVAMGKIKVYSHDWEMEATAGQLLDFNPNEPHEFLALEDNTRIFNLFKKEKMSLPNVEPVINPSQYTISSVEI